MAQPEPEFSHATVLREEVACLLSPKEGAILLDGTLGGGGHSEALLQRGAVVLGLDRDERAIEASKRRLSSFGESFQFECTPFSKAFEVIQKRGLSGVDGALLDLGISSPQVDNPARGFSFSHKGPLDMRMASTGETAAELIDRLDESELEQVLSEYGEERFAGRVARAIKRANPKPQTTTELASIVSAAIARKEWPKQIHPATRVFQGLRIAVNRELEELDSFLADLPKILKPGGRAAFISFHSLEDRRVKQRLIALEGRCTCPPKLPVCGCGSGGNFRVLTKKAITASQEELEKNPRARSARLRGVEKTR